MQAIEASFGEHFNGTRANGLNWSPGVRYWIRTHRGFVVFSDKKKDEDLIESLVVNPLMKMLHDVRMATLTGCVAASSCLANGRSGPQAAEEFEQKEIGSQFIAAVEASIYYIILIMR
jgi:hypothetical protein